MRKLLYTPLLLLFGLSSLTAQVKIGDNPQNLNSASILELESSSRALVISRVSTAQMNAITPLRGALVYNTDESCVFYFDGNQWNNLCGGTTNESLTLEGSDLVLTDSEGSSLRVTLADVMGQTFTTDPIVNFRESIIITENGNNLNFEVGQITGEQIVNSSIQGVDLNPDSITKDKLAPNSVGSSELEENAVTDEDIDYNQVTLNDFTNDAGYVTSMELISADPNNKLTNNNGAFYDDTPLQNAITNATQQLNDHLAQDRDTDPDNERITGLAIDNSELVITEGGAETRVDLGAFNNSGSDDQTLEEVLTQGNNAGGAVIADLGAPIANTDAATKGYVDTAIGNIPPGSDDQQLTLTGTTLTLENGGAAIDLSPFTGTGTDDQTLTTATLNPTNNQLSIGIEDGNTVNVDLSPLLDWNNLNNIPADIADGDNDNATDEIQTLSIAGQLLTLSNGGGSVTLPNAGGNTADGSETILNAGTNVTITGVGTVASPYVINATGGGGGTDDQQLSLSAANELTLEDGGTPINLTSFLDNTDAQTATQVPFTPYLTLAATNTQDAIQELKDEVNAIVTGGGGNPTDELQDLDLTADILTISTPATTGNQVDLSVYADQNDTEVLLQTPTDFDNDGTNETTVQGALNALANINADDQNDAEVTLQTQTDFDNDGTNETTVQAALNALANSNTDDQNDAEVTLQTQTDFDNNGTNETTVQDALNALASSSSDDQNDAEVTLQAATDFDNDGTNETTVQAALNALANISADDQNDAEVTLQAATDFDNDGTNETTVQAALNALANSSSDDQNDAEVTLQAATDFDNDGTNETTVQAALNALANSSSDDQNDAEVILQTATDFDNDGTNETTVQAALNALAIISGDDQNDAEVTLQAATDFDNDGTNETTVQTALNALANSSSDDQNASEVTVTAAPTNYTAATANVETHLSGIDTALGNISSDNFAENNLTLDANRTHNLNNNNLQFAGTGMIAIGNFGGPGNPAAPESKLDVNGQIQSRDGFAASPGTANLPSYGFYTNNDNDTGMFRAAEDQIGFSTDGTERLLINNDGNVRVGPGTAGAPSSTLDTRGSVAMPIRSSGTNTTLGDGDYTLIVTGVVNVTLPDPATCQGRIYKIVVRGAPANAVNFSRNILIANGILLGGTTLAGSPRITIQSDGFNWYEIDR